MNNLYPEEVPAYGDPKAKIWIIGDAPTEDDREKREPFSSPAGQLLFDTLSRNGIRKGELFLTNISKFQPYSNKFSYLENTTELDNSQRDLVSLLKQNTPNIIVCVGERALKFITAFEGIQNYRGSILDGNLFNNCKTISIIHPIDVIRNGSNYPVFNLDIIRIKEESLYSEVRVPYHSFTIDPRGDELEIAVKEILTSEYVSVDIETVIYTSILRCVGFGLSDSKAICIIPDTENKRQAIRRILESNVKKILQNGIFDTTILKENGYELNNYYFDTMVAQHILNPELPRALDFLSSIYTKEPYYKNEIVSNMFVYNCKDAVVTYSIAMQQIKEIEESGMSHLFQFEMNEIPMARDISMTGLLVDLERRKQFSIALNEQINEKRETLSKILGFGVGNLDVNANSTKQMQAVVYAGWGLPEKRSRKTGELTLDEDAVVALLAYCKDKLDTSIKDETKLRWKVKLVALKVLLEIRGLIKMLTTYIDIEISKDGRCRSQFKICSTETGRWAAQGYYDKTGTNAQTFPRESIEVNL